MAEVTQISAVTTGIDDDALVDPYDTDPNSVRRRTIPKEVEVYEINGPFFFGAAETFREILGRVARKPRVLIIRMRYGA